ncbi:MAG TPA: IPT/TIG domain-containing protein [Terriglobales bacterium]|nr:IPT/TIG domain-containing protein [Chthoniobacterales bacterium]HZR66869.1 IPT/TIG domain-containing protein [Terriglobales bacterium]
MSISDRILGKKSLNGQPRIEAITPAAALPGGEVRILGSGFALTDLQRPRVKFGEKEGPVVVSSDDFVVARVPEGAASGGVVVSTNGHASNAHQIKVATTIAENLHPVTNPALDFEGNIYVTFSGSRGQKVPVSIFKIDTNYTLKPFLTEMMNATAIAFDREGQMYVSSRFEGTVYRVAPNGTMSTYAESMGVATGIAFDRDHNLFVGDRSGTIFKIGRDRQIFVFATLEPSVSAYHLAVGPQGDLFVAGPTTSSFDAVYKIDPQGVVSVFYRGLGRPQGLAFDRDGNLFVAASLGGKRGIVKITPEGNASLAIAGSGLVGLAFAPGRSVVLATTNAVHHLAWDIQGQPLVDLS